MARIAEARRLTNEVQALLGDGEDIASARDRWSRGEEVGTGPNKPSLLLKLFMLNRLLDRHFRKAQQRMMSNWEVDNEHDRGPPGEGRAAPPT
ncbi:hypothetical protein G7077_04125 [Sphingomonas piscis]|uniref:Uncharacterized protein n=1 Tax=Sphingomonas piscis TaxID=2714943 RepID=A0A6G7YN86_9SPHN|nr:hypothetical protein [Sphingomonas piscis]QIK78210.1 hypothetical protein G7077_04125 [Sphingomonas piscis]